MKRFTFLVICGLTAVSVAAAFQKAKISPNEAKAINAMFQATTPDAQIAAAENLLTNFSDTSYKSLALFLEADCYQQKNDFDKSVIFGERAVDADPNNYQAILLLARQYAAHTGENDLDKEEKLNKATKYANDAIPIIAKAQKPRPDIPDDKWEGEKKYRTAQAHEALGMIADVRKKYDVAATEYKTAIDSADVPEPATFVRYAVAEEHLGKFDEAIASLDKVINDPNSPAVVKQYATNEKTRATNLKNAAKK